MAKKKKFKLKTMDVILLIVAAALLVFTIEMISIFRDTGNIPDTLCTCVFAALGGECGALAWLKTSKEKIAERKWQESERRREARREKQAERSATE